MELRRSSQSRASRNSSAPEHRAEAELENNRLKQSEVPFTPTSPSIVAMASKRALRALQAQLASPCNPRRSTIPSHHHLRQQTRPQSSSTGAIAYKALHRRTTPLPAAAPSSSPVSPAAAVSSILYETPLPSSAPPNRHVLNCLVQNEPGVLSRVSGILAARGFNIDSLVVCSTEVQDLSRMTIVLQGQDGVVEQARRQLEDLVPVWAVLDYTAAPLVQRELLLAKISILGPEYFEELLAHHREMTDYPDAPATHNPAGSSMTGQDLTPDQLADQADGIGHNNSQAQSQAQSLAETEVSPEFHPRNIAPSEALRLKHQHLETITYLTHQFGGKVLDISTNNCIVEVSAKPVRIDSFMKLISPFGILESARTGLMALPRSPLYADAVEEKEPEDIIDAASLPPS
ncbi:acetolactate synthase, regulatory subunit [Teratosphaeriaceae sp. CCFEE 6253]|nr:acetolactate synthase, regulatory subunit [Teratosphaeriaceae sp. CCFEE 6253]